MERFGAQLRRRVRPRFLSPVMRIRPSTHSRDSFKRALVYIGLPFMCTLLAFQPVQAQLLFADANALTELDEAEHFLLYDRITQLQIWATRLRLRTDAPRLALVTPVKSQQRFSLSKSKVFKAVDKVQRPVELKQRSLHIEINSWLLKGLTDIAEPWLSTQKHKYNNMKLSLTNGRLNRQQLVEWLLTMNYFVSATAMARLRHLERNQFEFELSELKPSKTSTWQAVQTPVIFRKYHGDVLRMPGVTFDSPVAHKQTIHILSDAAYELAKAPSQASTGGLHTQFREQISSDSVRAISRSLPKELRTYQRGGFLQTIEIQSPLTDWRIAESRVPNLVKRSKIAVHEPMRIVLPLELLIAILYCTVFLWKRERSTKIRRTLQQGRFG